VCVHVYSMYYTNCGCSRSRIIEGVDVVREVYSSGIQSSLSVEQQHSHVDFITDIGLVSYKNQQFITTSSNDGVLKIWK